MVLIVKPNVSVIMAAPATLFRAAFFVLVPPSIIPGNIVNMIRATIIRALKALSVKCDMVSHIADVPRDIIPHYQDALTMMNAKRHLRVDYAFMVLVRIFPVVTTVHAMEAGLEQRVLIILMNVKVLCVRMEERVKISKDHLTAFVVRDIPVNYVKQTSVIRILAKITEDVVVLKLVILVNVQPD